MTIREEREENLNPANESGNESVRSVQDSSLRIGSTHGQDTIDDEKEGYARDIGPEGEGRDDNVLARTRDSGLKEPPTKHPSKNLEARARGFGIGGGYERPYKKEKPDVKDSKKDLYGFLPHSGYYGSGVGARPFKAGQASFRDELAWYRSQYGNKTTKYEGKK